MTHRDQRPAGSRRKAGPEKPARQTPHSKDPALTRRLAIPWAAWAVLGVILLATLAVYWQAADFGFIRNDDELYVYENETVKGGMGWAGAVQAFTRPAVGNWHPLTMLSLMLDYQLAGPSPARFHRINILLHLLGTLCLFIALCRLSGNAWASLLAAAVYALHPTHVESVAWISARKDVLSGLFLGLTLMAYNRYARRPGWPWYLVVAGCLLLGLLSKPMLVTVPLLLLLIDVWPLNRVGGATVHPQNPGWKAAVLEKVPLGILAAVFSAVTLFAQRGAGAMDTLESTPVMERLSNALVACAGYAGKFFLPAGLAGLYPFLREARPWWQPAGAALILAVITCAAARAARARPWLQVGWLWFIISLLPVIGLVQVGPQASADRYTYIPYIGLSIMFAWGLPELIAGLRPQKRRMLAGVLGSAAVVAMGIQTYRYLPHWKDDVSFWSRVVEIRPDFGRGYYNLALAFSARGNDDRAMDLYRKALEADSGCVDAHYGLANLLMARGRIEEAAAQYREELRINPHRAGVHNNLALALSRLGRAMEAAEHFRAALAVDPNHVDALRNWGLELLGQNDWAGARAKFEAVLSVLPDDYTAHCRLADALAGQGNTAQAENRLRRAIQIRPDDPMAYNELGALLLGRGDAAAAVAQFRLALARNSGSLDAQYNLAMALSALGKKAEAIAAYADLLRARPDHYWGHNNIGILLAEQGNLDQALEHFDAAIRIDPSADAARHNRAAALARRNRRRASPAPVKRYD